jgi:hypothetical protein
LQELEADKEFIESDAGFGAVAASAPIYSRSFQDSIERHHNPFQRKPSPQSSPSVTEQLNALQSEPMTRGIADPIFASNHNGENTRKLTTTPVDELAGVDPAQPPLLNAAGMLDLTDNSTRRQHQVYQRKGAWTSKHRYLLPKTDQSSTQCCNELASLSCSLSIVFYFVLIARIICILKLLLSWFCGCTGNHAQELTPHLVKRLHITRSSTQAAQAWISAWGSNTSINSYSSASDTRSKTDNMLVTAAVAMSIVRTDRTRRCHRQRRLPLMKIVGMS